jgi:DNA-binding CsgD family transcriptional regulator
MSMADIGKGKTKGSYQISGLTDKEQERMDMLLQPNVKTYEDAAKRLGISEAAMKQTMGRVLFRYKRSKSYCNQIEEWKRRRRENRRS